jgi:hypothetical protein
VCDFFCNKSKINDLYAQVGGSFPGDSGLFTQVRDSFFGVKDTCAQIGNPFSPAGNSSAFPGNSSAFPDDPSESADEAAMAHLICKHYINSNNNNFS